MSIADFAQYKQRKMVKIALRFLPFCECVELMLSLEIAVSRDLKCAEITLQNLALLGFSC